MTMSDQAEVGAAQEAPKAPETGAGVLCKYKTSKKLFWIMSEAKECWFTAITDTERQCFTYWTKKF